MYPADRNRISLTEAQKLEFYDNFTPSGENIKGSKYGIPVIRRTVLTIINKLFIMVYDQVVPLSRNRENIPTAFFAKISPRYSATGLYET